MEPPGKLIMCFLQFVEHRGLCHMPEASEGREAVVESILVCGKGQEKQLRLTLCTPRICHSRGLIRASLNHVWAIGESLLQGFLNPTWDSLLEGRGGRDPKWPTKGCTYPFKGIAGERFLQWRFQRIHQVPWHRNQVQSIMVSQSRSFLSLTSSLFPHSNLPETRACSFQVWEWGVERKRTT